MLWQSWLARNAKVFAEEAWPSTKLHQAVWDSLIDAGRVAWAKSSSSNPKKSGR